MDNDKAVRRKGLMIPSDIFRDHQRRKIEEKVILGDLRAIGEINDFEMIAATLQAPKAALTAEFKIHLDWFGTSAAGTTSLFIDDVFLSRTDNNLKSYCLN